MATVKRGEFSFNGFRKCDVRADLYGVSEEKAKERRQMAAVGRELRLLRAHGLIAKVSKTHRYVITEKGRNVMTYCWQRASKHRKTHSFGRLEICANGENLKA